MRTVWKYNLDLQFEPQVIEMPQGAVVVHAQVVRDLSNQAVFSLWADIPTAEAPKYRRVFILVPTGGQAPLNARFVATMVKHGGSVWHLFEIV
jgi:hypothetical protein